MAPTLLPGDRFLASKHVAAPRRGEVVVFTAPNHGVDHVKRVVALAGDTVHIGTDGQLVVNAEIVPRSALPGACPTSDGDCELWIEAVEGNDYTIALRSNRHAPVFDALVPNGTFFVLGDNRDNSQDSRHYGSVPIGNIRGRPLYLYFSSSKDSGVQWARIGMSVY